MMKLSSPAMVHDPIWRRLFPLYFASFAQGLVLWYAIEKVFMAGIGFDASDMTLVVILGAAVSLLLEIPSGIVADRWSRRGVLAVSYGMLALTALFMGLSSDVLEFTLASLLFAVHLALYSGIKDAIVYDTVLEETGGRTGYEQYYSYTTMFTSAGLVIGSLLGGVVGDWLGLPAAFFLSIPGAVLAVVSLLFLREPKLHKQSAESGLLRHTAETLRLITRRGSVLLILAGLLSVGILYEVLAHLDQLWPLALDLPVIWYGPLNAGLLLGFGLGAPLAAFIADRRRLQYVACVLLILCTLLLTVPHMAAVAVAQIGGFTLVTAILIVLHGRLHDNLPSRLRSGSSSAVSTLRTLVYLPLVYVFGVVTVQTSVFTAAYMLLPLAVLGAYGLLRLRPRTG